MRKLKRAWGAFFVLLSVASILDNIHHWLKLESFSGEAKLALSYLFLLALVFASFSVVQEYRLSRKSRYAETLTQVGSIFNSIEAANFQSAGDTKTATVIDFKTIEEVVNELVRVFDLVTATRTASCVKLLWHETRPETRSMEGIVGTFCRDSDSGKQRLREDSLKHWISDNTAFQNVVTSQANTFFCNDLTRLSGYRNTSAQGKLDEWRPQQHSLNCLGERGSVGP